jgi:hypothetical protein
MVKIGSLCFKYVCFGFLLQSTKKDIIKKDIKISLNKKRRKSLLKKKESLLNRKVSLNKEISSYSVKLYKHKQTLQNPNSTRIEFATATIDIPELRREKGALIEDRKTINKQIKLIDSLSSS